MAFDWKSALERLDPRKWDAARPEGKARDFVVRLWPYAHEEVNHQKTKNIVSAVIIFFA